MRKILKRTYKYEVGNIYIKSDVPIDEEKLISIIEITEDLLDNCFLDRCYYISRKIYHQMEDSISLVKTYAKSNKIKIRLIK